MTIRRSKSYLAVARELENWHDFEHEFVSGGKHIALVLRRGGMRRKVFFTST